MVIDSVRHFNKVEFVARELRRNSTTFEELGQIPAYVVLGRARSSQPGNCQRTKTTFELYLVSDAVSEVRVTRLHFFIVNAAVHHRLSFPEVERAATSVVSDVSDGWAFLLSAGISSSRCKRPANSFIRTSTSGGSTFEVTTRNTVCHLIKFPPV